MSALPEKEKRTLTTEKRRKEKGKKENRRLFHRKYTMLFSGSVRLAFDFRQIDCFSAVLRKSNASLHRSAPLTRPTFPQFHVPSETPPCR